MPARTLPVLVRAAMMGGLAWSSTARAVEPPPASPPEQAAPALFAAENELVLELRTPNGEMGDTVIAYGSRAGVWLPFGDMSRFLDLAIAVGDAGHFASGWFLNEKRRLLIDLRQRVAQVEGRQLDFREGDFLAHDGELYVRAERFATLLPLTLTVSLPNQSVTIKPGEPFPYEERVAREQARERLATAPGARAKVERPPRLDVPYRALDLPMMDAQLRVSQTKSEGSRGEYDLRVAGDLAFMTAQAFLAGNDRQRLSSVRLTMGRQDPDRDLLGPLGASDFQIGDVSTPALPLGLRGTAGRGAFVTNVPLQRASLFDSIDFRGELLDGFEVELYRNNILISSTRTPVAGRYEFLQVPLEYGLNVFRLVFYGPQGQRREEVRPISVGDSRLPAGELVYSLGAAQKNVSVFDVRDDRTTRQLDDGAWRVGGLVEYGLSRALTVALGGSWYQSDNGTRWVASAGIRTGLGGVATRIDAAMQSGGAQGVQASLAGRLFGFGYGLLHSEYRGGFEDETRSVGRLDLQRATELQLDTAISLGGVNALSTIPLSWRARRLQYGDGAVETTASLRASAQTHAFLIANNFDYNGRTGQNDQLRGAFTVASAGGGRGRWRGGIDYAVLPKPSFAALRLDYDRLVGKETQARLSIAHSFPGGGDTRLAASVLRPWRFLAVGLDGYWGVQTGDYGVGLRIALSIGRNPLSHSFFLSRQPLASGGAFFARSYLDSDHDGTFGQGDELLPGTRFRLGGVEAIAREDGVASAAGFGGGAVATSLELVAESLPDVDLAATTPALEVVSRPGRAVAVNFPVTRLAEIEGTTYFVEADRRRAVAGVLLNLTDLAGNVVATTRSESDGFFLFERVLVGTYQVTLDPDQRRRLALAIAKSEPIDLKVTPTPSPIELVIEKGNEGRQPGN